MPDTLTPDEEAAILAAMRADVDSGRYNAYRPEDVGALLDIINRDRAHLDALTAAVPDAESLSAAMNEAYGYRDRDNAEPLLPFYDDIETFWDPFAARVLAILRGPQPPPGSDWTDPKG